MYYSYYALKVTRIYEPSSDEKHWAALDGETRRWQGYDMWRGCDAYLDEHTKKLIIHSLVFVAHTYIYINIHRWAEIADSTQQHTSKKYFVSCIAGVVCEGRGVFLGEADRFRCSSLPPVDIKVRPERRGSWHTRRHAATRWLLTTDASSDIAQEEKIFQVGASYTCVLIV